MKFPRFGKWIHQTVLIGMFIPGNVLFIAQYLLVMKLGVLNTHWALFLPYTAGALPLGVLLLAAFMKSLPGELEEAAIMDGLSSAGLFGGRDVQRHLCGGTNRTGEPSAGL
ncbi:MAG: hypothetical protein BAA01_12370 [Bacillus thermozeamaize]|uniref:ABC transmembrane type-1 domain-containing protein n=1 Tax=Bacillus thermozeamaize TaxID=230954 RepID=A0A1Y3PQC2_9BACI|nr:MAG: hypothetical protein BAA01_12370 [Bacillus thermozeamaize]